MAAECINISMYCLQRLFGCKHFNMAYYFCGSIMDKGLHSPNKILAKKLIPFQFSWEKHNYIKYIYNFRNKNNLINYEIIKN